MNHFFWGTIMKKIALVIFLTSLLTGNAFAQLDPDDDGIGVYFDPCACVNCLDLDQGEHMGYIVITHPTAPAGVGGWEAKVWAEGGGLITGHELIGNAINAATREHEFIVGLGDPISNPYSFPAVVVAMLNVFIIDTSVPTNFFIDAVYFHSLPESQPAYLDGADYSNIIKLQQSTGGADYPVATINGECAVATDATTFDGVKALYR
jgi:hypothetical protein